MPFCDYNTRIDRTASQLILLASICKESIVVYCNKFRYRTADEHLIAVLREYETRGEKGYQLTNKFFDWFRVPVKLSKHCLYLPTQTTLSFDLL
jgi:hypothetical protein